MKNFYRYNDDNWIVIEEKILASFIARKINFFFKLIESGDLDKNFKTKFFIGIFGF